MANNRTQLCVILILLAGALLLTGCSGKAETAGASTPEATVKTTAESTPEPEPVVTPNTNYNTDPVPDGRPNPVEWQDVTPGETQYSCTLSVVCGTILDNMSNLNKNKAELVPESGIIFPPTEVTFYENESVFNVLQREMKVARIHMEHRNTPIYNSAYIMGINNLYEFDCGELSGWMYKVNGWYPNYGCSRYQLKDGDIVEWVYTCDLGRDIGGGYAVGGQYELEEDE